MQSLKCGQCGSPDIEFLPGGFGRCRNCRTAYAPQGAHPAPMPPVPMPPVPVNVPPPFPPPPQYPQPARPVRANPAAAILILLVVFGLVAAGAAWFLFAGASMAPPRAAGPGASPTFKVTANSAGHAVTPGAEVREVEVPPPKRTEAELRDARSAVVHGVLVWTGRCVNTGETPIVRPSAVLSLFDATGKRVTEQAGYSSLDWLDPGQWCAISCSVVNPPEHARAEFRLAKLKAPDYESPPIGLKLLEWGVSNDGFGTDRISGTLRNESAVTIRFARIVVFGLDAAGLPVSDSYSFASEDEIPPGGESGFQVSVTSLRVGPAARYQVQASGMAK